MNGALEGIRVLDFSHALAGPFCTMILADLGADVVKLEQPDGGDRSRRNGPFVDGIASKFASVNRGKRSIVVDLKRPEGRELAVQLACKADVLVQNFAPGAMARLGLDYETLAPLNPGLIYVSCSGFGATGSWADRIGVDPIIQAMAGAMSITGDKDGSPVRVGYSMVDLGGGMWMAMGALAALNERSRSGKGQFLDISLLEGHLALLENAIMRFIAGGEVPGRLGSRHPYGDPLTHAYETRNGWIVAGMSAHDWQRTCAILGHPEWVEDPVLGTPREHLAEAETAIKDVLRSEDTAHWVEAMERTGAMCIPINTIAEALSLPPVQEREFIQDTVDSQGRHLRMAASPLRLSRTPPRRGAGAPILGEDSAAVLSDWVGVDEDEYAQLASSGLFEPRDARWDESGKLPRAPRLSDVIG